MQRTQTSIYKQLIPVFFSALNTYNVVCICAVEDITAYLIPFHDVTACDANNSFYKPGKKFLYDEMVKNLQTGCLLLQLIGKEFLWIMMSWISSSPVSPDTSILMHSFVALAPTFVVKEREMFDAPTSRWWQSTAARPVCQILAYIQCHPEPWRHLFPVDHGWKLFIGPVNYCVTQNLLIPSKFSSPASAGWWWFGLIGWISRWTCPLMNLTACQVTRVSLFSYYWMIAYWSCYFHLNVSDLRLNAWL